MTMKVADGATMQCTHEIVNCSWSVQGHLFTNTFKILPLSCYDAILGMEWLETFSPMQMEWKQKWLSFTHQGRTVKLKGITYDLQTCPTVTLNQLSALAKTDNIWSVVQVYAVESDNVTKPVVPVEITKLVDQFPELFAEPI